MMECKDIRPLLPEYAAGTLDGESAAQVADHLLLCPICAGELERLEQPAEEVPAPVQAAEARSFATEDPLAAQKEAAPVQESPAEDDASKEAPAPAAAPKKKMRRRNKVLLALLALLLVLGIGTGVLYSRDAFDIRDGESIILENTRYTALVYRGASRVAEDGFRIGLWKNREQLGELAFPGWNYGGMQWSQDGRYIAVECLEDGFPRVQVGSVERMEVFSDLAVSLTLYLSETDALFGGVHLQSAPACTLMGWNPDNTLLIAATGVVDTNIDPDYGIELAEGTAWSLNGFVDHIIEKKGQTGAARIESENSSHTVSGYFVYDPDTHSIRNIYGFGLPDQADRLTRLKGIAAEFRNSGNVSYGTNETYYEKDALLELVRLPLNCRIEAISYRLAVGGYTPFEYENWWSLKQRLTEKSGIVLFTNGERTVAYVLVVPLA